MQDKAWVVNDYSAMDYVIKPKERLSEEDIEAMFHTEDTWVSLIVRDTENETCEDIVQVELSQKLPYGTKMTRETFCFVFDLQLGWIRDDTYRDYDAWGYCEIDAASMIGAWHFKNDFLNRAAYLNIYDLEVVDGNTIQLTGELLLEETKIFLIGNLLSYFQVMAIMGILNLFM